jgi:hypothetical protein
LANAPVFRSRSDSRPGLSTSLDSGDRNDLQPLNAGGEELLEGFA